MYSRTKFACTKFPTQGVQMISKKAFIEPELVEEATLSTLTLGLVSSNRNPDPCGQGQCDD